MRVNPFRWSQISIIVGLFIFDACSSDDVEDIVDCTKSTLTVALSSSTDASSCIASDGVITVTATGGSGPYSFVLNSSSNTTGSFSGLPAGSYMVVATDANGCERSVDVTLSAIGSTLDLQLTATSDTECLTNNGSITVVGTGGVEPYQYRINGGAFNATSTFSSLAPGSYTVEVKDNEGCIHVKSGTVARGNTGISYAATIKPIINTKCAISGCHNGDNGANRNWTVFANVADHASDIKRRTGNRSMPLTGSLTQEQIDLIACWVDDGAPNN